VIRRLLLALLLSACGGAGEDGQRAVEAMGFSNVRIGERSWNDCGRDDSYNSHFTAINPAGHRVSGVVCCGYGGGCGKGCTVRF
jgi:hypothetical protein